MYFVHCSFMHGLVASSQESQKVWDLAPAALSTKTDLSCLAHTHVFYTSVSVGSSDAESMPTVFYLGRMENDVDPYLLPNPFCFHFIYCYISLWLTVFVFAYSRMDFGTKTSERMFSDVRQIQLTVSLYSQFTALQTAHVIISGSQPKLTDVFLSLNVYFHLWAPVRI